MRLELIKNSAIIGALGALAITLGCFSSPEKPEPYVEICSQKYDEKKEAAKKQIIDINDYKDKIKEEILLPNWRRFPF